VRSVTGGGGRHARDMRENVNSRSAVGTAGGPSAGERERALEGVRRLERVFATHDWREGRALQRARKRARKRAHEVIDAASPQASVHETAVLSAAGELLLAMRAELALAPDTCARVVADVIETTGLPAVTLAHEVFRSPDLLSMPPTMAMRMQLTMLAAFAPLRSVSLWALEEEHVTCLRYVGDGDPPRSAGELARRLLAGEVIPPARLERYPLGVALGRRQQPLAALIGTAKHGTRDRCAPFLADAAPMLAAILERHALLATNAESERALVESSERKLTRLGFDLHDGPIQDVAVLADDLRLFQSQLEVFLASPKQYKLVRGRIEDLTAQLGGLEDQLRRISSEVHAPALLDKPFNEALRQVADAFSARTKLKPRLMLEGDAATLTISQHVALINIITEALNNVREHSKARHVAISVSVNAEGVEAQVVDDGCGFDPETTLIGAARNGRLGLVAMHERVRLLGGQCRIDSRPGGPTVISVALDRWEPLVGAEAARHAFG
jgi:signal transduction histidine kinase